MIWEIDDGPREIEGLDQNGRPDPAYAADLGLLPARAGARVLAAVLEWLVAVIIALPALLVVAPAAVDAVLSGGGAAELFARDDLVWIIVALAVSQGLMIAYVVVQLVLHGRKGVTLGKAICGIRSVNVATLERPGFWRGAVVRYLVAYASLLVPVIGPLLVIALSPLFDIERRGRGWLDLAAATWFVDVRAGLNPYDQKRMRIARKRLRTPEIEAKAPLPSLATPIDRDAEASYVPSARFSGGVLGAHRSSAPAAPAPDAVAAPAGMVAAVPPSLAGSAAPPPVRPIAKPVQPVAEPVQPVAELVEPVAEPVEASGVPVSVPVPHSARAVLVLDNGESVEITGVTLLGRAPAAAAGETAARLVSVADDTRSVSKTHLALMPARRGVFVVDRGSTNGSAIVRDGIEQVLVAGHPVEIRTGDSIRFGDRTMQVERA